MLGEYTEFGTVVADATLPNDDEVSVHLAFPSAR